MLKTIILGAGYSGLAAATQLKPTDAMETLLIERFPQHVYHTRLHEAAAHDTKVSTDIVPLLKNTGVHYEQAEVDYINADEREVVLKDGRILEYDRLVVGLGSVTNFYRIPGLAEHAAELKTREDAREIYSFVNHTYHKDYEGNRDIVIGGAGLTGVELITELAKRTEQLSTQTGIPAGKLFLVEAGPHILPVVEPDLRERAIKILEEYGIEILTSHKIMKATEDAVTVQTPDGNEKEIKAGKIVWTGGIMPRDILRGESLEKGFAGRIVVDEYLRAKNYPEIFVLGDMGLATNEFGKPVPTTAQHAGQQGRLTGANLMRLSRGEPLKPYRPYTQGEFVSLGGVMAVGWMKLPAGKKLSMTGAPAFGMKKASEFKWQLSLEAPDLFQE